MISRTIFAAGGLTLLAACGGGGGASSLPAHPGSSATPGATASSSPVTQTFVLTIPAQTSTASNHRRSSYISPDTASIRITVQSVNGASATIAPTVVKLAAGVAGCASDSAGDLTCTVAAAAAAGLDVFAISTYASSTGTGTPLASTTLAENVVAGSSTPVTLSLGGVPAAIAFSPASLPLVNDGAIHRYAVTLDAVDAAGATIVGSAAYQSPIALQITGDPTHALSLSTASVSQPGTVLTVTFDGSKSLSNGLITATGTGVAAVTLAADPLTFTPTALVMYDDQTSGASTTVTQTGFTGSFLATIANAQDGSVTVTAGPLQSGSAVATVTPAVTFDVTSLAVNNGSFTATIPVTILPQPGTYAAYGNAHQLLIPSNLVEGPGGLLWSDDQQAGTVDSFNPANGVYTSYLVDPNDAGPTSIAFDANGLLWFADGAQIGSFNPATQAVATYSAGLGPNARVLSIVAGAPGTMWFYDEETNEVPGLVGSPSAFGTIATASGTITEFATPDNAVPALGFESMTLGPDGALWFVDAASSAIGRVTANGTYSSTSIQAPESPNLEPHTVVTGPDGNIWFAGLNVVLGTSTIGTVNPTTGAVATYTNGVEPGDFYAMIVGSDRNIWFAERLGNGFDFSTYDAIGVINPTTHATYAYAALAAQYAVIASLVDRGDRTLWMLDNANGQIGKVSFK